MMNLLLSKVTHFLLFYCMLTSSFLLAQSNIVPNEKSQMNFEMQLDFKAIEDVVNSNMPSVILEDNSFEDNKEDNLKYTIYKKGEVTVGKYNSQMMKMVIPLRVKASKRIGGWGVYTVEDFSFSMNMIAIISGSIDSFGNLITRTTIQDFEFTDKASITVLGYDLDITSIVENQLLSEASAYEKSIDQTIKKDIPMKSILFDLVQYFSSPMKISDDYNAWVKSNFSRIEYQDFSLTENSILSRFNLESDLETFISSTEPVFQPITKLPPIFKRYSLPSTGFINSFLFIPYEEATLLAQKQMVNETFSFKEGKYNFTVEDIIVSPEEDQMQIQLMTKGDFDGTIFITGTPYYQESNQTVYLQKNDFKVKTRNVLHKVGAFVLEGPIQKKLEKQYGLPLEEMIISTRDEMYKGINTQYENAVFLKGNVKDISILDVKSSELGIEVHYKIEYNLNAHIKNLTAF